MTYSESDYETLLRHSQKVTTPTPTKPHTRGTGTSKYRARRTIVDGITFPSLLEARCYTGLKLQWLGGLITEPLRQVPFSLGTHYGVSLGSYVADFVFIERGEIIIADAKGHKTREYLKKKKLVHCIYGLKIREYRKMDL